MAPGDIMGGSLGGMIISGFIPPVPQNFTYESTHIFSFCKTANVINRRITLSKFDIENAQSDVELELVETKADGTIVTQPRLNSAGKEISKTPGQAIIDLGTFIFDALTVTDLPTDFEEIKLTEQEKTELKDENENDRVFRKLFEEAEKLGEKNRFVGIRPNHEGIAFRLDNGSDASNAVIGGGKGLGSLSNYRYRDGTSREIVIDLNKEVELRIDTDGDGSPDKSYTKGGIATTTPAEGQDDTEFNEGDTLYITFIEVKEHYLRQYVNVSWFLIDASWQCYAYPVQLRAANFRFYNWQEQKAVPNSDEVQLIPRHGWRVVEACNLRNNNIAVYGSPTPLVGFPDNVKLSYATFRSSSYTDFRSASSPVPDLAYREADWYNRRNYNSYDQFEAAFEHSFYNMHPQLLHIPDMEKFGIEKSIAQEMMIDIGKGTSTFIPVLSMGQQDSQPQVYMANGEPLYMGPANTRFEPIQPVSQWNLSDAYSTTESIGTFTIFGMVWRPDMQEKIAYHSVDSPIIRERFDIGTHVLIERFFAYGASQDIGTFAIRGMPRPEGKAIGAIVDPSQIYSFAVHPSKDSLIVSHAFKNKRVVSDANNLYMRPDLGYPLSEENSLAPVNSFAKETGYGGLLGDSPGHTPGMLINVSKYGVETSRYYVTNAPSLDTLGFNPLISKPAEQIKPLTNPPQSLEGENGESRLVFKVPVGFYGETRIRYSQVSPSPDHDPRANLVFRLGGEGGTIQGVVDNVYVSETGTGGYILRVIHEWTECDTIELVGEKVSHMADEPYAAFTGLNSSQAKDFLEERKSNASKPKQFSEKRVSDGMLFRSDVATIAEDKKSNLYVFFNDAKGGISAACSPDFGYRWYYQYGVVESFDQNEFRNPFAVTDFSENKVYLFFQFMGKLLVKPIALQEFNYDDANVVEKLSDIYVPLNKVSGTSGLPMYTVKPSIYSDSGYHLRRDVQSFVCAGNLHDGDFWKAASQRITTQSEVKTTWVDPNKPKSTERQISPVKISLSAETAFVYHDVSDIFYSVYRNKTGAMNLFFLSEVQDEINEETGAGGGGKLLQCHFSTDNGITWFDLWEHLNYKRSRAKIQKLTDGTPAGYESYMNGRLFIDLTSDGTDTEMTKEIALQADTKPHFGINLHWSRLKKHKRGSPAEADRDSDSQVLAYTAPYVFYQESFQKVFIFYVYEDCLLCKIVNDYLFYAGSDPGATPDGMRRRATYKPFKFVGVKNFIERQVKAYFIDGDLSNEGIRTEIHNYYNKGTNEIQGDGNIIFPYSGSLPPVEADNQVFDASRAVLPQRFAACELQDGFVRVFYMTTDSDRLHAAIWNGNIWKVEDMLYGTPPEIPPSNSAGATVVYGGFGSDAFSTA